MNQNRVTELEVEIGQLKKQVIELEFLRREVQRLEQLFKFYMTDMHPKSMRVEIETQDCPVGQGIIVMITHPTGNEKEMADKVIEVLTLKMQSKPKHEYAYDLTNGLVRPIGET